MHEQIICKMNCSVIPFLQYLMVLATAQQRQPVDRLGFTSDHGLQQCMQASEIALNRLTLEQRGGICTTADDLLLYRLQRQGKVELAHDTCSRPWLDFHSRQLQLRFRRILPGK